MRRKKLRRRVESNVSDKLNYFTKKKPLGESELLEESTGKIGNMAKNRRKAYSLLSRTKGVCLCCSVNSSFMSQSKILWR